MYIYLPGVKSQRLHHREGGNEALLGHRSQVSFKSGAHKGGFSKGRFGNNHILMTHKLLNLPLSKPPFVNSRLSMQLFNPFNPSLPISLSFLSA